MRSNEAYVHISTDNLSNCSLAANGILTEAFSNQPSITVTWDEVPQDDYLLIQSALDEYGYYSVDNEFGPIWIRRTHSVTPETLKVAFTLVTQSSRVPFTDYPMSRNVDQFLQRNQGLEIDDSATLGFVMKLLGAIPDRQKSQWSIDESVRQSASYPERTVLSYILSKLPTGIDTNGRIHFPDLYHSHWAMMADRIFQVGIDLGLGQTNDPARGRERSWHKFRELLVLSGYEELATHATDYVAFRKSS